MRFSIHGTGVVGKTMATRLAGLEHEVMVGTHDPEETVSRTESDAYGHPPFSAWQEEHPEVRLGTFSEAAAHGEMVLNIRSGGRAQPERQDTHRPRQPFGLLKGHAAFALGSNTDSPGEQIQRRFPEAKVVKTLHTMNANLMVDPAQLAGADHTVFVSGNDSEATDTDLGRHHYRAGYRDSAPSLVAALRCATEARLQLQDRPLIRDCVLTEQYLPTA